MVKTFIKFCFVAAVIVSLHTGNCNAIEFKGVSYTGWSQYAYSSTDSNTSLANARDVGCNWVSMCVWWFQKTHTSTDIEPNYSLYSADPCAVQVAVNRCHQLGMRVMLKPMVDLSNDSSNYWRGEIVPSTAWFTSYTSFIDYWADFATANNCEMFCIGCELVNTDGSSWAGSWRSVASSIRTHYSGPITYAANWGDETNITWWNAVDYIGIDAYYPLTSTKDPTLAQLQTAWTSRANSIQTWRNSHWPDMNVMFTECGYASYAGTNITPYQSPGSSSVLDLNEQNNCYAALLSVCSNRSWWKGAFWWDWETDPCAGGLTDKDYTPQNKPAEVTLRNYYFALPMPVYAAGKIVAWGYNYHGECNVPLPDTGFTAIAGGGNHSLGLKQDGSIVAWGSNGNHQCNVPKPNTGFVAIAAGGSHSLGLKQDGSIVAWGYNNDGECDVPEPNTGFVAVAAGGYHSLGLKTDGSIVAWGWNGFGECNVPEPNTGFTAIAAGYEHSLGLKQDGSIVAWGSNGTGQCTVPEPNTGFKAVSAGWAHSLGLKTDGSIVAWGDNLFGQCTVPFPNTGFTAIAAGTDGYQSLGLKKLNITIAKCTVTAGKTRGQDAFSASGAVEFPADLDFNDVNRIDVNIISLTDGASIHSETVDSNVMKGKFKYTHKIRRGGPGGITSLVVDVNKNTFSINVQKVDLTGLACPLRLDLIMGGPITGDHELLGDANEAIVNGKSVLIPIRLMRLYKDTLVVNKAKVKHSSSKPSSDALSVAGDIAVKDMDLDTGEPNLVTKDVVLTWGDHNGTPTKTLTIPGNADPAHGSFKASKTGHVYKCSKIHPANPADEDVNSLITAQFDLDKCTFTVSVSKASSVFAGPADANFGVSFDTFSETADVNHVTGRSW